MSEAWNIGVAGGMCDDARAIRRAAPARGSGVCDGAAVVRDTDGSVAGLGGDIGAGDDDHGQHEHERMDPNYTHHKHAAGRDRGSDVRDKRSTHVLSGTEMGVNRLNRLENRAIT